MLMLCATILRDRTTVHVNQDTMELEVSAFWVTFLLQCYGSFLSYIFIYIYIYVCMYACVRARVCVCVCEHYIFPILRVNFRLGEFQNTIRSSFLKRFIAVDISFLFFSFDMQGNF